MAIATTLPRDANRVPLQNSSLQGTTLASTYDATVSASTEIVLQTTTTAIEVTATGQPIVLRWGASDASTTNFDAVIPAGATYIFAVPNGVTAVNFIEAAASATIFVREV